MPRLEVQPAGIRIELLPGETVMAAARRSGYFWPTVCNGAGTCKTCVLEVVDGGESFVEADSWEADGLSDITPSLPGDPERYRLACQARLNGDAVVRKIGVKPMPT